MPDELREFLEHALGGGAAHARASKTEDINARIREAAKTMLASRVFEGNERRIPEKVFTTMQFSTAIYGKTPGLPKFTTPATRPGSLATLAYCTIVSDHAATHARLVSAARSNLVQVA